MAAELVESPSPTAQLLSVEGPSQVVVTSGAAAQLHSGRVTGYVPPRAVGFAVGETRCELSPRNRTRPCRAARCRHGGHVFAGAVRVDVQSAEEFPPHCYANEAVRVAADSPGEIAGAAFVGEQFVPQQPPTAKRKSPPSENSRSGRISSSRAKAPRAG